MQAEFLCIIISVELARCVEMTEHACRQFFSQLMPWRWILPDQWDWENFLLLIIFRVLCWHHVTWCRFEKCFKREKQFHCFERVRLVHNLSHSFFLLLYLMDTLFYLCAWWRECKKICACTVINIPGLAIFNIFLVVVTVSSFVQLPVQLMYLIEGIEKIVPALF